MNKTCRRMGMAIGMAVALLVANAVQAQLRPVATTPAKAPQALAAPVAPADGPDTLFAQWDTNHDKVLSPAEFRAGWQALQTAMALRRLREQFVALDTDKSGSLDTAEYAHLELIKHAGASAPPMSVFDTDKNQRLDFKEYVNAVNYMLRHDHK